MFAQVIERGYEKYAPRFIGHINVDAEVIFDQYDKNRTFLHRAAFKGHSAIVKLLLENHANVDPRGDYYIGDGEVGMWERDGGSTPLILACCHNRVDCVAVLIEFGANVDYQVRCSEETALHDAARNGHIQCVQLLLNTNARVNVRDSHDELAYTRAIDYNHPDCADLIRVRMQSLGLSVPLPRKCILL